MTKTDRLPRKLAAVFYADVAGYSRLTADDEDATHRRLSRYLDLIAANVKRHGGRVMHYAGDAVLAKFEAVVDALGCATDVQRDLAARNADVLDDRRVQFRIGVNLGDVIEDRGDIYGDGVNVAARLEALAGSGEICVSDAVRVAVGKRLPVDFEDLGEQQLKNIEHPVRAYRVRVRPDSSPLAQPSAGETLDSASVRGFSETWLRTRRGLYASVGLLGLVVVVAILGWQPLQSVVARVFAGNADSASPGVQAVAAGRASLPTPRIAPLTFDGGMKDLPRLSPDGSMVAFQWDGPSRDNLDIYTLGIGRDASPIRLTQQPGPDVAPVWSPDGRELAFVQVEAEGATISVVAFPSGRPRKLTDVQLPIFYQNDFLTALSWSPDGAFLTYGERPAPGEPARIVRLDVATLEKHELTARTTGDVLGDFAPSYSPDGRTIAFVRGPAVHANRDIWIMNADGSEQRRITTDQWSEANGVTWLPATDEVAFSAGDLFVKRTYSVSSSDGAAHPLRGLGANDRAVSAIGDRLVFAKYADRRLEIFQAPGRLAENRDAGMRDSTLDGSALAFSPRGDRIAWQSRGVGLPQIWMADRDMANARPVTDQKTGGRFPQWSPDGAHVAFESYDRGNADVYVIDIETGRAVAITTDAANEMYPSFSADGRWIYFAADRGGVNELLKIPAEGGAAQPAVTGTSLVDASWPMESDGFLYYQSEAAVWRARVGGSAAAEQLLELRCGLYRCWSVVTNGVYYSVAQEGVIRYLDLQSRDSTAVFRGPAGGIGLTVSPDEQAVFFSRAAPLESELWLVEDFR